MGVAALTSRISPFLVTRISGFLLPNLPVDNKDHQFVSKLAYFPEVFWK